MSQLDESSTRNVAKEAVVPGPPADAHPEHDLVLVVDYGAQFAQLIARRVREARVYSEIVPHTMPVERMLERSPKAIILSGGPSSVYAPDAPQVDPGLFETGVAVFGICYGFQAMAGALGGDVRRTGTSEFGRTDVQLSPGSTLLDGLPQQLRTWMSHGDEVAAAPPGFEVLATSQGAAVAAFEDLGRRFAGVQWHPEVLHTEHGQRVLEQFLLEVAGCRPTWTMVNIVEEQIEAVREAVGHGRAICGLSGGVDSAVAAALVQRAIGDRLTCVFVDHGLLRAGEAEQVERDFVAVTGVDLHVVDAADRFLAALAGVDDPEDKRKIIGREFIRVFEAAEREIVAGSDEPVQYLVQGTLYPDVVESGGGEGAATIKSHHNVGGLPDDLQFSLVEPLRTLFKDEVRQVGEQLGLPGDLVWRHPFPGPGLAIRVVGAVDAERLRILRAADAIAREEVTRAGLDRDIWQFPVVLLADVRSVGVQGDGRTYGHPVVLRPVTSEDAMTADWSRLPYDLLERISTRITNEVREVNRVVLDITSKPPGTIEWE
ncbi:MAG: GMP synthase [glutamine-hydrolyzing], amidotransferase subunit / GMP synthase [glutamine-hydrolyzing], ATP pyrophosphatase subunit [uncultured Nocardioidaceae bacterium]|uniref:GMP synthase [glutamine-hydrolyzing] n=1 Tax=uncultured Nocardioidaceae bacterium TaxID=253824 RepID=A0A6J4L461_9ACTN|nr:MAG: GMP synthase [glutamine-hydrolyzing], amidotransferase subunit / GMP synthase [glutamine-hydrolyzing], ATP pyrophosphatase subunit [uncultured Nocardioidaceae bacterium]